MRTEFLAELWKEDGRSADLQTVAQLCRDSQITALMSFICPGLSRWQVDRTQTRSRARARVQVCCGGGPRALDPCTCPAGLTGFISTGLGTVITLIKPDHGRGNWIGEDISSHAESSDARREAGWMSKIFLQSAIEQDTLQRCREQIRKPGEHPGRENRISRKNCWCRRFVSQRSSS